MAEPPLPSAEEPAEQPEQPEQPVQPVQPEPSGSAARPLIAPPWSPVATPSASYVPRPPAAPEPNDGRSFTERYRGTQWDSSTPIAPVIGRATAGPTPLQRGGPSILLLAGVGMLLAVVAVIGVLLYTDSQRPGFLPAAVLPSSSPADSLPAATLASTPSVAISPSATPSSSLSAPPASVTPPAASPTPTEPLVLPDDPAEAFVARMLYGASYSVTADGRFDFGGEEGSWGFEMDVAGSDLGGVFTIAQKRVRLVTDIIVKENIQYDKPAGEGWVRREGNPEGMPMDILAAHRGPQSFEGLEYVGAVRRDRMQLHHLRLPSAFLPQLSTMWLDEYDGGLVLHDFSFDLWITDDGRPRSADVVFDGTVRSAGAEVDMTFNMNYRFSRWGEPTVIEAPEQYTDPGYTDG